MRRRFCALAMSVTVSLGCAESTAIIGRPSGPPLKAEIDSSDASTLRLRGPNGELVALDQYGVSDIDHPGNVWAAVGLGLAAGGALFLLPSLLRPKGAGRPDGFQGLGIAFGVGGIVEGLTIFTYNIAIWGRSRWRARGFESARPPDGLIPPAAPGAPITIVSPPVVPLPAGPPKDDDDPGTGPPVGTFHR